MKKNAIPTEGINLFNWMEHAPAPKPGDKTMLETVTEVAVKKVEQTPLLKQYDEIKKKRPGSYSICTPVRPAMLNIRFVS